MSIQVWFPLGLTGWISLQSRELSRVFSGTIVQKHQFLGTPPSLLSSSHIHTWLLGRALTVRTFVGKVMSLLFNTLSRFVIAFLPRSKRLLISWLQSPSAVILEPKKLKADSFHFPPIYLPWSDEARYHNLTLVNMVKMTLKTIIISLRFRGEFVWYPKVVVGSHWNIAVEWDIIVFVLCKLHSGCNMVVGLEKKSIWE